MWVLNPECQCQVRIQDFKENNIWSGIHLSQNFPAYHLTFQDLNMRSKNPPRCLFQSPNSFEQRFLKRKLKYWQRPSGLKDLYSLFSIFKIYFFQSIITSSKFVEQRAWLVQLIRSLPSDHKVPSSILALPRFEYLCDLLFCLS